MRGASIAIARSLSILGHPLVVVPVAVVTLVFHERTSSAALIAWVICGIAGFVLAFSFWQVRRGQWQHIDASGRTERRSLNVFLAVVLFLGAAVAFYLLPRPGLSFGLLSSGLLVAAVMLASPWFKLSLHGCSIRSMLLACLAGNRDPQQLTNPRNPKLGTIKE